ncbi:hypothetical protein GGR50DRAFT_549193 [Xylaria sp. CBS 124048]|nr:hypothetical protein GGR50DRAFT_549193 [Xylaria sp. CBS 124048]
MVTGCFSFSLSLCSPLCGGSFPSPRFFQSRVLDCFYEPVHYIPSSPAEISFDTTLQTWGVSSTLTEFVPSWWSSTPSEPQLHHPLRLGTLSRSHSQSTRQTMVRTVQDHQIITIILSTKTYANLSARSGTVLASHRSDPVKCFGLWMSVIRLVQVLARQS